MKKTCLNFMNYLRNLKFIRISRTVKRSIGAAISVPIFLFSAIPAVNAFTPTNINFYDCYDVNKNYTLYGDLNSDANVNSFDFEIMKRLLLGSKVTGNINKAAADLDGNGSFDALDYAILWKALRYQISSFPVEKSFKQTLTGSKIDVALNKNFQVTLEESGGTGYLWFCMVENLDFDAFNAVSVDNFNCYPFVVGGSTQKVWTFKACKPGKYTLVFTKSRYWLENDSPIATVKCEINVQ